MATPVKFAATRLNTVPVPQIAPPSKPRTWPAAGPRKYSPKFTGSPTSGFFMKYTFQIKQDSSAPSVRKTLTLYGPKVFPWLIACATNGDHSPISTPETMQVVMLFFEVELATFARLP